MRLLAFAFVLTSFSAFANCPKLAGTYANCRSTTGASNGSSDMVVTQTVKNGITTYTATSTDDDTQERSTTEMIADGKVRTETVNDPDAGEATNSVSYTCVSGKLIGKQTISFNGQVIAKFDQEATKKGNAFEMAIKGKLFEQPVEDRIICE